MTICLALEAVAYTAKLHRCHVFQIEDVAVFVGADDNLVKLFWSNQTSAVAHHILECRSAVFTELTRSSLDVLVGESRTYIGRHKVVLCHGVWLEPDTHRVVGTHHHRVSHAVHTLNLRDDVDFHIVFDEFLLKLAVWRKEREHKQH